MPIPLDNFKCVLSLLLICRVQGSMGLRLKGHLINGRLIHHVPSPNLMFLTSFLLYPPSQYQLCQIYLFNPKSVHSFSSHHHHSMPGNVISQLAHKIYTPNQSMCLSFTVGLSGTQGLVMSLLCPAFQINLHTLTLSPFPIPPIWRLLASVTASLFFVVPGTYHAW